jgi:hypothetical protein
MHHGILGGSRGHPSQASANNPAPDFLSISGNPCNHSIHLPKKLHPYLFSPEKRPDAPFQARSRFICPAPKRNPALRPEARRSKLASVASVLRP